MCIILYYIIISTTVDSTDITVLCSSFHDNIEYYSIPGCENCIHYYLAISNC